MQVLTTVDTIHRYVPNIPADDPAIQAVCGYVTEVGGPGGDIEWTSADFGRFPNYVKHTICQLPAGNPAGAEIIDLETSAATDAEVVRWVKARHDAKLPAHIYADVANVPGVRQAVYGAGEQDQTYLWLANWNLDEQEATALLGTMYEGFMVEGVQWASPTSNPHTLLPGTSFTLLTSGCDLSVTIPFSGWKESTRHLVSVIAVATYSDGTKKSWTVS